MSARITQRTDGSQTSFATSSAGTFTIRTDDPLLSYMTVPMVTVMLGFGKQSGLRARSTPPPLRTAIPPRIAERLAELTGSGESAGDLSAETSVAGSLPETDLSNTSTEHAHRPPRGDRRQRLLEATETPAVAEERKEPLEPEAAAAEPATAEAAAPALGEAANARQEAGEHANPSSEKPARSHRLEMTIDSLPHHELTEPIPIVIDPLGDTIFTASMSSLDISATGNSIGEGLLLLKEQIEFVYGDLSRRSNLTADQKTTLQILHTYIRPNGPRKPEWF